LFVETGCGQKAVRNAPPAGITPSVLCRVGRNPGATGIPSENDQWNLAVEQQFHPAIRLKLQEWRFFGRSRNL